MKFVDDDDDDDDMVEYELISTNTTVIGKMQLKY